MKYTCEKCNRYFYDQPSCEAHEKECKNIVTFKCDKCENEITYERDSDNANEIVTENQCHTIDLGYIGYGSLMDGINSFKIHLCDNCLFEVYSTLSRDTRDRLMFGK